MSSNEELVEYLVRCEKDILSTLIRTLRSRACMKSIRLSKQWGATEDVPEPGTPKRLRLAEELVTLLGWYGSNALAYLYRRLSKGAGGKPYLSILRDVTCLFNRRLAKKERKIIPLAAGVDDLENTLVEILVGLTFRKFNVEEVTRLLTESGVERHIAEEVAKKYGPVGLVGVGLPIMTKILGKKEVMNILQLFLASYVGKYMGRDTATKIATRFAVKFTQRTISRLITGIGWTLLALDLSAFATSPARRITTKAVPAIALARVCERFDMGARS